MSQQRIAQLRNLILKAKQAYYYGGNAIMSDAEYDALEDELREFEPADPLLATVGAPVPPDNILSKAKHRIPMGSQSKVNTNAEYATWHQKCVGDGAVQASLKGDGASAAAYYEDGRLVQAISRGDGFEGEDITANAMKFKGLPALAIDSQGRPFSGAVRFEVILTLEDWGRVDPQRAKNPRNVGSGIMGRKNGELSELLSSFAFSIDEWEQPFEREHQRISRLVELGFQVIENRLCSTLQQALEYYREIALSREDLPFWIDGVVFKVDDLERQRALGMTANRPKGQVAWKFDSKGAETTLLGYSLTVGHTGAVIPTAHLEPVEIGGTTVKSALLNNWAEIERLDVEVGDRVWLIKANDIIPKIVGVRKRGEKRQPIAEPRTCPVCESAVRRRRNSGGQEGAVIECSNAECPARSLGKIKRWIKALDIQGIGDSVRRALVEQLQMEDVSALYRLRNDPQSLASLVINREKDLRLGDKRAATILESIEKSRQLTLVQFLGSLGIQHLGQRRVELILEQVSDELGTLDDWRSGKLRDEELAARAGVPSVGANIQDSIDALGPVIERLLQAGVSVVGLGIELGTKGGESTARALRPKVCISGKLPSGKKKTDYDAPLREAGYELVGSVTKDTAYLVVGDPSSKSQKAQKARQLGTSVIGEEQLQELLEPTDEKAQSAQWPANQCRFATQIVTQENGT